MWKILSWNSACLISALFFYSFFPFEGPAWAMIGYDLSWMLMGAGSYHFAEGRIEMVKG